MVNEVNNIIYNLLVQEQAAHLPGVGTLSVVRRSAEMESSDLISAPTYVVEFSSHAQATSVVDAIAYEGSIDIISAEDIYSRWLERVRSDSTLIIEGVGTLRDKSFVADPEFIAMFNAPGGKRRIKKHGKKGGKRALVIILVLLIVAALCAAGWFFRDKIAAMLDNSDTSENVAISENDSNADLEEFVYTEDEAGVAESEPEPELEPEMVIEQTDDIEESEEVTEVEETEEPEVKTPAKPVSTTPNGDHAEDWTLRDDIRHWVVVGSYSTEENAERALQQIKQKHPDTYCDIFTLGWMYAVAAYGSADRDDCVNYMRKYRYEYDQMWIFTPNKYK